MARPCSTGAIVWAVKEQIAACSPGISAAGRGLPVAMTSSNSFSLEDKSPFTDMLLFVSPSGEKNISFFYLMLAFSGELTR